MAADPALGGAPVQALMPVEVGAVAVAVAVGVAEFLALLTVLVGGCSAKPQVSGGEAQSGCHIRSGHHGRSGDRL